MKSRIHSITVNAFRAYRDEQTFDLNAPVVVLYGPNGLGKTSLFDAIDFACTGRIGRLCRQQRGQDEFARIATHLSKGAAQGETFLTFSAEGSPDPITVRRSVSDWNSAWQANTKYDRKHLLTLLTGAKSDSSRVQNLESLFRATHLFGQDDQELLLQFREQSVIPSELVTRMLALDDYAASSTKVSRVVKVANSTASSHKNESERIAGLLAEKESRLSELAKLSAGELELPLPQLSAEIEQQLKELFDDFDVSSSDGDLSAQRVDTWVSLLESELERLDGWLLRARQLSDQIEVFGIAQNASHEAKQALLEASKKTALLEQQSEASKSKKLDHAEKLANEKKLFDEASQLEASLNECIRVQESAKRLHRDIATTKQTVESIRTKQTDITNESRLIEREIETLQAESQRCSKVLGDAKQRVRDLQGLRDTIPKWQEDIASVEGLEIRRSEISAGMVEARKSIDADSATLGKLTPQVSDLQREYDDLTSNDAELTKLLDEIEKFVVSGDCPTCGTPFQSAELLKAAIEKQKVNRTSVVQRHVDRMQAAKKECDAVRASLDKNREKLNALTTEESSVAGQLRGINERLSENSSSASRLGISTDIAILPNDMVRALDLAEQDLEKSEEANRRQEQALTEVNSRSKALASELPNIQTSLQEIESALDSQRRQLSTFETKLQEQLDSLGKSGATKDSLEQDLENLAKQKAQIEIGISRSEHQAEVDAKDEARVLKEMSEHAKLVGEIEQRLRKSSLKLSKMESDCEKLGTEFPPQEKMINTEVHSTESRRARTQSVLEDAKRLLPSLKVQSAIQERAEIETELVSLRAALASSDAATTRANSIHVGFERIRGLLNGQRDRAIETHVQTYGPLITVLQQRLRSVYGFGHIDITAKSGEILVEVDWDGEPVKPIDYFSDSQKQILMLSVYLAGCPPKLVWVCTCASG